MAEFNVKAEAVGDEGRFSGVLSTYGNVDFVGDICEKGCFDESIQAHGTRYPLLYQHDASSPIGHFDVVGTDDALRVEGQINMQTQKGREAYALLKAGDINGLSIGYEIGDNGAHWDEQGIRHLTKLELREGSIVTFPANPLASARAKSLLSRMALTTKGMDAPARDSAMEALRQAIEDAGSKADPEPEKRLEDQPSEGKPQDGQPSEAGQPAADSEGKPPEDDAGKENGADEEAQKPSEDDAPTDGMDDVKKAVENLLSVLDRLLGTSGNTENNANTE